MLKINNGIIDVADMTDQLLEKINYYYETIGYINARIRIEKNKDSMKYLNINLSSKCNMKCSYCFHNHTSKDYDYSKNDKFDLNVLDNIIKCNPDIEEITISGKECLLKYDDVIDIIKHYPDKKFVVMTNFLNINKLPEDIIYNNNVEFLIGLELSGNARKTLDNKNQFELIKNDINRITKTKRLSFNIPYGYEIIDPIQVIKKLRDVCNNNFDLTWHYICNFTNKIDNSNNYDIIWRNILKLSDEDIIKYSKYLPEYTEISKISSVYDTLMKKGILLSEPHICGMNIGSMSMSPTSGFSFCVESLKEINIKPPKNNEDSQRRFLEDRYKFMRSRLKPIFNNNMTVNHCRKCKYRLFCIEPCELESKYMNRCEMKLLMKYRLTLLSKFYSDFVQNFNNKFSHVIKDIITFDKTIWEDVVVHEKEDVIQCLMKKN